jgi:hypothetical protein
MEAETRADGAMLGGLGRPSWVGVASVVALAVLTAVGYSAGLGEVLVVA